MKASIWTELADSDMRAGEFRVVSSEVHVEHGDVLIAVDAQNGRHVLIPVGENQRINADTRSAGIHLLPKTLEEGDAAHKFADLVCRKPNLNHVFDYFVQDLLSRIARETAQPVLAAQQTLAKWRELFAKESVPSLSAEELTGFFGELWWLDRLASTNPESVFTWVAPLGSYRDFQSSAADLEVKTTTGVDSWRIRVHGIDQLDNHPDRLLFLCVVAIRSGTAAGVSLNDLVDRIAEKVSDQTELWHRLLMRGWTSTVAEHYGASRYELVASRTYDVSGDFPRLLRSHLSNAGVSERVSAVDYNLDLTGYADRTADESAVLNLFNG